MTNEEAIKVLQSLIPVPKRGDTRSTETTEISVALIMAISALSQIESAGTQITNSNLKSESEKPIKHFGAIECPNCGRLLMLEEQTYDWFKGCKEYDTEKHCCHRYSSFIRESLQENINAVLEDIKVEIDKQTDIHADGELYIKTLMLNGF